MEDIKMSIYGLNNMNMFGMNSMGYGGMGMFNMGGINLFGNMFGSSIFTNCDGSYNYNAMAGFGVGQVLMNIGGMAISQWVTSSKANSQENLSADIGNLDAQIESKLKELNEDATVDNYNKVEVAKSFDEAVNTTTEKYNTADNTYKESQKYIEDNKSAYDAACARRGTSEAQPDDAALIKEYEEAVARNSDLKQAVIDAKEEMDAAIEAKEAEQTRINNLKRDIADMLAERDAIQAQLNEKILDKADGTKIARTTAKEFSKMYNFKEKDFNTGFNASNVSKSDLRYIISQYRTSEDTESKNKWAEIMKKIYNDPNLDSSVKSDNIRAAYKLMCE